MEIDDRGGEFVSRAACMCQTVCTAFVVSVCSCICVDNRTVIYSGLRAPTGLEASLMISIKSTVSAYGY